MRVSKSFYSLSTATADFLCNFKWQCKSLWSELQNYTSTILLGQIVTNNITTIVVQRGFCDRKSPPSCQAKTAIWNLNEYVHTVQHFQTELRSLDFVIGNNRRQFFNNRITTNEINCGLCWKNMLIFGFGSSAVMIIFEFQHPIDFKEASELAKSNVRKWKCSVVWCELRCTRQIRFPLLSWMPISFVKSQPDKQYYFLILTLKVKELCTSPHMYFRHR